MADEQISTRDGGVIKPFYKSLLGWLVEIDHYIPAEDNIKLQFKPYRFHEVKPPEDHI